MGGLSFKTLAMRAGTIMLTDKGKGPDRRQVSLFLLLYHMINAEIFEDCNCLKIILDSSLYKYHQFNYKYD